MASNGDYVREELKRLGYNYRDQATKDIMSALVNFKDLKPKSDLFVSNTGERKHRLSLDGTIPVNYRGATYNIPVRIWIRQDHPYSPPIPFVKPTETMRIKVSRHVDQAGMIYMPYLHNWNPTQSDLGGLIQVMTIIFSEQPPVYARSAQPPPPPPQQQQQQPPRMPTPTPNPGYQSSYGQPTPYPPASGGGYPKQEYRPPPPPPPQTASPYPRQSHPQPLAGYMPMPYPPPSAASQQPPYPGRSAAPYPTPTPHSQPPQPQPPYPPSLPKPAPPVVTNPIPASSPVAVATTQGSFDTTVGAAPLAGRQDSFDMSADTHRDSLKSAVEDKLRRQLKEIWERAENEMQSLHKTKEDLEQGSRKLNGMLETLDQKQKEVEENICTMTNQDEKIRDALSKLELSVKEMNVEKIVVPAQPLYDQIFRLYAEENAIEDTIFYLTEGLRKGVVDVDVYLKHVRGLSRSQFEKRALMQKARKRAGLGEL